MNTTTTLKICKLCVKEKPITEFHINKACKDGYKTWCKECIDSKRDSDKAVEYSRKYRLVNKEKISDAKKLYRKSNREHLSVYHKAWIKSNQDKMTMYERNRRARLREATGTHTLNDIQNLFILQRKKCAVCLTSIVNGYHVDHIVALVNGGSNDKYNLQLLCANCNCRKNAKDPIAFMNENGRLI